MNIPNVSYQNEPSFGIKYMNKGQWDKNVLQAFEKSNLLKTIDKKYPNASIIYNKFYEFEDDTHTLIAKLNLAKDKSFRWTLSSHNEEVPKRHFIDFINTANLEDIENKAVSELKPMTTISIKPVKSTFFEKVKSSFGKLFT